MQNAVAHCIALIWYTRHVHTICKQCADVLYHVCNQGCVAVELHEHSETANALVEKEGEAELSTPDVT